MTDSLKTQPPRKTLEVQKCYDKNGRVIRLWKNYISKKRPQGGVSYYALAAHWVLPLAMLINRQEKQSQKKSKNRDSGQHLTQVK